MRVTGTPAHRDHKRLMVGAGREARIDEDERESQEHHNRLVTHGEGRKAKRWGS